MTKGRWALATVGILLAGLAPGAAQAKTYKLQYTSRAVRVGDFDVQLPKIRVRSPHRTGYVTHMTAILVDNKGRRLSIRHVMLHHLVFLNDGPGVGAAPKGSCQGRHGQPFYGTGEEHQHLVLPKGYGYPVDRRDRWRMQAMLMSHDLKTYRVRVRYTLTFVTGKRLEPVVPFWIRANGCASEQPSYTVQKTADDPGAVTDRTWNWKIPFNGVIVAAGGHLHGGAVNMTLNQPRCDNRELLDTAPNYGDPDYLSYRIRPVLHEPGPRNTRYFLSQTGIPVVKGENLILHGIYDATHPRARVMSIMHVYVARRAKVDTGCPALPADARELAAKAGRTTPPYEPIPLSRVSPNGKPYTIARPAGPLKTYDGDATVRLAGDFTPARISIPFGAKLTWKFSDPIPHNVLFADGPAVSGAPTLRNGAKHAVHLIKPGRYTFFCYLHPVTMHQEVIVRPPAAGDEAPAAPGPLPVVPAATRAGKVRYADLDVGA